MITHYAGQSIPGERGTVAVLFLVIATDTKIIMGATIMQANPAVALRNRAYVEVARASGSDWADAEAQLMAYVDQPYNRWLKEIMYTRR